MHSLVTEGMLLDKIIQPPYNIGKGADVMYSRQDILTDAEQVRFEEVKFYQFIKHLFKVNPNPVKVHSYIDSVSILADCNQIIIDNLVSMCMMNDKNFVPTHAEHIYLLIKANTSVRKTMYYAGISQREYYKVCNHPPEEVIPKLEPKQYIEAIKFMDCLTSLLPERIDVKI
jgi:hypothetical protein